MRSFTALAAGLFAASVIATPLGLVEKRTDASEPCDDDAPPCMTYDQAQKVANNFKTLISDYSNATAEAVLTVDFTDYSDSVTELINSGCKGPQALGEATFDSRVAFEAGQGSQPNIPFELLNLWHTCDTVVIRWRTTVDSTATQFVTGIIVLETEYNKNSTDQPFLIDTVYSEFNSGAWLVDLGVFKPTCDANGNGPPPPPSASTKSKRSLLPVRMM